MKQHEQYKTGTCNYLPRFYSKFIWGDMFKEMEAEEKYLKEMIRFIRMQLYL